MIYPKNSSIFNICIEECIVYRWFGNSLTRDIYVFCRMFCLSFSSVISSYHRV